MFASSSSSITTKRSPAAPPRGASLPFPRTLSCRPSLAPAGMLILTSSSSRISPCASAPAGILSAIFPNPWQAEQVVWDCICPKTVFTIFIWAPLPLQVGQVLEVTPSANFILFTLMVFCVPLSISSKFNFIRIRRLEPLTC